MVFLIDVFFFIEDIFNLDRLFVKYICEYLLCVNIVTGEGWKYSGDKVFMVCVYSK